MKAIIAPIDILLRWFLIILTLLMVLTVTWQVFSRYALRAPSSLTEELARFQLIWLGLLGAVYTFRNRMHVGIDIFTAPLTGKKRVLAEMVSLFCVLLFSLVMSTEVASIFLLLFIDSYLLRNDSLILFMFNIYSCHFRENGNLIFFYL